MDQFVVPTMPIRGKSLNNLPKPCSGRCQASCRSSLIIGPSRFGAADSEKPIILDLPQHRPDARVTVKMASDFFEDARSRSTGSILLKPRLASAKILVHAAWVWCAHWTLAR